MVWLCDLDVLLDGIYSTTLGVGSFVLFRLDYLVLRCDFNFKIYKDSNLLALITRELNFESERRVTEITLRLRPLRWTIFPNTTRLLPLLAGAHRS